MEHNKLQKILSILPASIKAESFPADDRILLTLHEPQQNLKFDGGAFEGWTLMLHMQSPHTHIVLDIPNLNIAQEDLPRFRRLLYRAHHFGALGYQWFSLGANLMQQTDAFAQKFYSDNKRIQPPTTESRQGDRGEKILQRNFSSDTSILKALPECEGVSIQEDLPLDLYWGRKKSDVRPSRCIFPSEGRFVDLWCLKEDHLNIFELKYQDPHMGVVSELFFYACLSRDVFFNPVQKNILFPRQFDKKFRGVDQFYQDGKSRPVRKINAWFLADRFHPALEVEYICEMISTDDILFQVLRYSYDMPISFHL